MKNVTFSNKDTLELNWLYLKQNTHFVQLDEITVCLHQLFRENWLRATVRKEKETQKG